MNQCSFSIRGGWKHYFLIILNSHNSFLWPEYFIDFFMWKMDPMSGFKICLVFTLPPRDSTLQYKRCIHLWNNFPCIKTLIMIVLLWTHFNSSVCDKKWVSSLLYFDGSQTFWLRYLRILYTFLIICGYCTHF